MSLKLSELRTKGPNRYFDVINMTISHFSLSGPESDFCPISILVIDIETYLCLPFAMLRNLSTRTVGLKCERKDVSA